MNLSTIRAVERSKEVGLRKVMGALRNHLGRTVHRRVGVAHAHCLRVVRRPAALLMPLYTACSGIPSPYPGPPGPSIHSWRGDCRSGFPGRQLSAFFLSGFSPIRALKGKLQLGKGGSLFRQASVVVQFSISFFFFFFYYNFASSIAPLSSSGQDELCKKQGTGYDKTQALVVPIDNNDI